MSLLLPLLIVIMVAVTGVSALTNASRRWASWVWPPAFGALTALSVIGPIVALAIFRDSPDRFVSVATVLVVLLPITVIVYSLTAARSA